MRYFIILFFDMPFEKSGQDSFCIPEYYIVRLKKMWCLQTKFKAILGCNEHEFMKEVI